MLVFFEDRKDAGRRLFEKLRADSREADLVLALPRGGLPVAAEIASGFKIPLDIILVRKIGAPFQPELALGAVVEGNPPSIYLNEKMIQILKVDEAYLESEKKNQIREIEKLQKSLRKSKELPPVKGKRIFLVDDGVATGASIRSALQALKDRSAAHISLVVPVSSKDTLKELEGDVDQIICLQSPDDFTAVGQYYRDFRQVELQEVVRLMESVN